MTVRRDDSARAAFERAFVATRFMLGAPSDPTRGLLSYSTDAGRVAYALSQGGKEDRALILAAEWGKVAMALKRLGVSHAGGR